MVPASRRASTGRPSASSRAIRSSVAGAPGQEVGPLAGRGHQGGAGEDVGHLSGGGQAHLPQPGPHVLPHLAGEAGLLGGEGALAQRAVGPLRVRRRPRPPGWPAPPGCAPAASRRPAPGRPRPGAPRPRGAAPPPRPLGSPRRLPQDVVQALPGEVVAGGGEALLALAHGQEAQVVGGGLPLRAPAPQLPDGVEQRLLGLAVRRPLGLLLGGQAGDGAALAPPEAAPDGRAGVRPPPGLLGGDGAVPQRLVHAGGEGRLARPPQGVLLPAPGAQGVDAFAEAVGEGGEGVGQLEEGLRRGARYAAGQRPRLLERGGRLEGGGRLKRGQGDASAWAKPLASCPPMSPKASPKPVDGRVRLVGPAPLPSAARRRPPP